MTTINISKYQKLDDIFKELSKTLEKEWTESLDQDIDLTIKGFDIFPAGNILLKMLDSYVFTEYVIDVGNKSTDKLYLMFPFKDAIIISGTTLKQSTEEISELQSLYSINKEYAEAFHKFSDLTNNSFQSVFSLLLDDQMNTKFNRYMISPKDNNALNEIFSRSQDQILFTVNLELGISNFDNLHFSLILPLEFIEGFQEETIQYLRSTIGGRILVVDDSKNDIAIIRKQLRKNNFLVAEGHDEQSTFRQIYLGRIDLILLDIYLENENGLNICRKIRRNMLCDGIPIIMYSCGATKDNIILSMRAGAQDFIAKPFSPDILNGKITKYCGGDKPTHSLI